jgi:hypothetical protein
MTDVLHVEIFQPWVDAVDLFKILSTLCLQTGIVWNSGVPSVDRHGRYLFLIIFLQKCVGQKPAT